MIQVVLISESTRLQVQHLRYLRASPHLTYLFLLLQCMLANYGILTQTPTEVEPVQIWPPGELVKVLTSMGKSKKLKLSGRPVRPLGSLGTSKLYRVAGKTVLCYPLIFR